MPNKTQHGTFWIFAYYMYYRYLNTMENLCVLVMFCQSKFLCGIMWAIIKYKLMYRWKHLFIGSSMSGPNTTILRCLLNWTQFKMHLETIQLCFSFHYFQFWQCIPLSFPNFALSQSFMARISLKARYIYNKPRMSQHIKEY